MRWIALLLIVSPLPALAGQVLGGDTQNAVNAARQTAELMRREAGGVASQDAVNEAARASLVARLRQLRVDQATALVQGREGPHDFDAREKQLMREILALPPRKVALPPPLAR